MSALTYAWRADDGINSSDTLSALAGSESRLRFRLPTETEWEYAARGGPHWKEEFAFSGSNDPERSRGTVRAGRVRTS